MIVDVFHGLVLCHIVSGAVGLCSFWGPVLTRKGSTAHRRFGFVFAYATLATGVFAIGISLCSLLAPLLTHPDFTDPALTRGLFGWMMLYLALLTISLGWHALMTIRHKRDHPAHRTPLAIALQVAVIAAAANCAVHGFALSQPLMIGIAIVGLASGVMTLSFIALAPAPGSKVYVLEHIRSGVGAGISAYTAFLSVGLVRLFPEHAFNPAVWSVPVLLGVSLIVFFQRAQRRKAGPPLYAQDRTT
jgi:hypothetical protein